MRILVDKVRAGSATVGFLINMKTGAPDLCSADLGGVRGGLLSLLHPGTWP